MKESKVEMSSSLSFTIEMIEQNAINSWQEWKSDAFSNISSPISSYWRLVGYKQIKVGSFFRSIIDSSKSSSRIVFYFIVLYEI